MSIQSDAAKRHIVSLLEAQYEDGFDFVLEYQFHPKRKWRFDFAVPSIRCAIEG